LLLANGGAIQDTDCSLSLSRGLNLSQHLILACAFQDQDWMLFWLCWNQAARFCRIWDKAAKSRSILEVFQVLLLSHVNPFS